MSLCCPQMSMQPGVGYALVIDGMDNKFGAYQPDVTATQGAVQGGLRCGHLFAAPRLLLPDSCMHASCSSDGMQLEVLPASEGWCLLCLRLLQVLAACWPTAHAETHQACL